MVAEKLKPGAKTVTIRAKPDMDGDYQKVGKGQGKKVGVGGSYKTPNPGGRPGPNGARKQGGVS